MNFRMKRRRFGQIVIATAATTMLTNIPKRTSAQQSLNLSGLRGVSLSAAAKKITEDVAGIDSANTIPEITLHSLELVNNVLSSDLVNKVPGSNVLGSTVKLLAQSVDNPNELTQRVRKAALIKKPSERITAFTANSDGTFTVAIVAATKDGDFTRLTTFQQKANLAVKPKAKKLQKITRHSTVESLVAITNRNIVNSQFLGVVSLQNGLPPFMLAAIDDKGTVSTDAKFGFPDIPQNLRLSNLVQSPIDGKIYAIVMNSEGIPNLVYINLTDRSFITGKGRVEHIAALSFDKKILQKDLASLAFSPSGGLFALIKQNNQGKNLLCSVNLKSGELKFLQELAVEKIAFLNS